MLFSQTILSSYSIDLYQSEENKSTINFERLQTLNEVVFSAKSDFQISKENSQILSIENEKTNELFIFIKDLKNITILKYNSALFLKNEYVFPLQNLDGKSILGCSFSEDGNPIFYLSSNLTNNISLLVFISIFKCNLETKTHTILNFKFPTNEFAVTTFQMNNSFHILAQHRIMQELILYTFKDDKVAKKGFDFSHITFQNKNGKMLRFNNLTKIYPIEKMDVDDYNALDIAAKKNKIYIHKNHLFLTLDYNPKKTHAFDINLENYELYEKNFPQSILQDPKKISNSFYQDGKLYQVNATESELLLDIKDFNSGETLKSISVLNKDDKSLKNTTLFIQKDSQKPTEVKKAKKFLEDLYTLDLGISIFKNRQNTFIYIGGTPKIKDKEKFFQTSLSYNNLNDYDPVSNLDFPPIYHLKSVYFENILNKNLELVARDQSPLALDKLNYFLNESENQNTIVSNVLKFKDYYILGYYDQKTKQFIIRKFTDGFN